MKNQGSVYMLPTFSAMDMVSPACQIFVCNSPITGMVSVAISFNFGSPMGVSRRKHTRPSPDQDRSNISSHEASDPRISKTKASSTRTSSQPNRFITLVTLNGTYTQGKHQEAGSGRGHCYLLSTALDFPEEERMMQQSSVSISLSFENQGINPVGDNAQVT